MSEIFNVETNLSKHCIGYTGDKDLNGNSAEVSSVAAPAETSYTKTCGCNCTLGVRQGNIACPEHPLDLTAGSALSASMSKSGDGLIDYSKGDDLERMCKRIADELYCMNCKFPTVSAFTAILSFVGFLASLTYRGENDCDGELFKKYCNNELDELKVEIEIKQENNVIPAPKRTSKKGKKTRLDTTLADVLYGYLRCGLVHALSLRHRDDSGNEKIAVEITHQPLKNARTVKISATNLISNVYSDRIKTLGGHECTILRVNAFDLLDSVRKSIAENFKKNKIQLVSNVAQQWPVVGC